MRLESQKKLGYYPTPISVVKIIQTLLEFPTSTFTVLDPCCGEGIAVNTLVAGKAAQTYGIELDEERAKQAKLNLNHVIFGDYQQTRMSIGTFSVLWQNPPYDQEENERKEFLFLRNTIQYLKETGVLVYIIPQHRLDIKIAKLLAFHCQDIRVWRFPEKEYQAFRQIVIMATKKIKSEEDIESCRTLSRLATQELLEISGDQPLYVVPTSKPVLVFQSTVLNEKELEQNLKQSPLWQRLDDLTSCQNETVNHRPPLPLRTGHLALVLASGVLDGEVGDGETLHIVKGQVVKETRTSREVLEKEVVEKETDVIRVCIKILQPNGQIKVLM